MNEQTIELIEQLAQKLGTTTEYLWSVLLKQAPIDSSIGLFQGVILFLFGLILFKLHKRFMKKDSNDKYSCNFYEEHEEAVMVPMVIFTLAFIIISLLWFFNISDIITGFVNPEYYALNKILKQLK